MFGVPKIVLERLRVKLLASRPSAIGHGQIEHPDANLLTAFVEKTLTAGEQMQVLNHLAECAECREVVALTLPAEVAVAEPARLPVRPRWNLAPALRWGALATALGAVIIIILVLHTRSMKIKEVASKNAPTTVVASASNAAPQPLAQPPAPAILNAATTAAGAKSRESQRGMAMLRKRASPPRSREMAAQPVGVESKAQAPMPAAVRPPAVAGTIPAKTESVEVSTGLNTDLVGVASASAPPQPQALIHSPERSGLTNSARAAEQMRKALQARLTRMGFHSESQKVAVQPGALWTISSDGKLQRSGDGGKNWQAVPVNDQVTFRAIQTIGREIWAGGTALTLYHSSDGGVNWTRVNLSSAGAPTTEAIVSINSSPSDIQHISVRTETGRQWTSEDGGQHWKSVTSDE